MAGDISASLCWPTLVLGDSYTVLHRDEAIMAERLHGYSNQNRAHGSYSCRILTRASVLYMPNTWLPGTNLRGVYSPTPSTPFSKHKWDYMRSELTSDINLKCYCSAQRSIVPARDPQGKKNYTNQHWRQKNGRRILKRWKYIWNWFEKSKLLAWIEGNKCIFSGREKPRKQQYSKASNGGKVIQTSNVMVALRYNFVPKQEFGWECYNLARNYKEQLECPRILSDTAMSKI